MIQIELRPTLFDPWQYLSQLQTQEAFAAQVGATAVFVGSMRDFNEGDSVRKMFLEHYPSMTDKHLHAIAEHAKECFALQHVLIVHRVGEINPSEAIVLVAVWSSHRQEAFLACREIMEELKKSVPFWKKETLSTGKERWVAHNTVAHYD